MCGPCPPASHLEVAEVSQKFDIRHINELASLQDKDCRNSLIWLDINQGDVLMVSYGITINNQVIATGDVEISREDKGLIVREIGAALAPRATDGLRICSS